MPWFKWQVDRLRHDPVVRPLGCYAYPGIPPSGDTAAWVGVAEGLYRRPALTAL